MYHLLLGFSSLKYLMSSIIPLYILGNMNASVDYIKKKYALPLKYAIAEITGLEYEIEFFRRCMKFRIFFSRQIIRLKNIRTAPEKGWG